MEKGSRSEAGQHSSVKATSCLTSKKKAPWKTKTDFWRTMKRDFIKYLKRVGCIKIRLRCSTCVKVFEWISSNGEVWWPFQKEQLFLCSASHLNKCLDSKEAGPFLKCWTETWAELYFPAWLQDGHSSDDHDTRLQCLRPLTQVAQSEVTPGSNFNNTTGSELCATSATASLFPLALLIVPLGWESLDGVDPHVQHPLELFGLPFVLKGPGPLRVD